MQNNLIELYNLLTLLKPGIFKTQKEFRAAYMTAGKPRQPANSDKLRDLMRDAMIRNTRAVVALKLPRRHASTRGSTPDAAEQAAYRSWRPLSARPSPTGSRRQRLAAHHLLGAAGLLARRRRGGDRALRRSARRSGAGWRWRSAGRPRRGRQGDWRCSNCSRAIPRRRSSSSSTIERRCRAWRTCWLAMELVSPASTASLSGPDKDAAIADFRDSVPVLLCTESGGEGRNIQFCNTLINFDIPWNPMAIEQRIGRIDRIGQSREVFVFNLVARGTVEEQVLRLLDEKINMFELVVGEAGAILGELDEERNFADLVLDAWLETTVAGRAEAFDALGRRLDEARTQYGDAKALDEALFGEDFETA